MIIMAISAVLIVIATIVVYNHVSNYYYEQDNAARRNPMDNLANFHHQLKEYLVEHEGQYPAEKGVFGLAELVSLLSDLRVKDDKNVWTDPDYLTERITSYAYIASGLSEKEMDVGMPVIFEKPWNRKRVRVLLCDGRVEELELNGINSCSKVVEYYKERVDRTSTAWDILLRNAKYIDGM